jgi:hypothetical protein
MNKLTKINSGPENQHQSTYALLLCSEEKSRNAFEILIYPLLLIGVIIAIWQFALQTTELPSRETKASQLVASISGFHSRS